LATACSRETTYTPSILQSAYMSRKSIYTFAGTVQAGGGLYIKRKADDELLDLCRGGELAFILSSRQVGKSSLMIRVAEQLEAEEIRSGVVDLSAIGVMISQDEWYLGILNEITNTLSLKINLFAWWDQHKQLGHTQSLINFFRDVVLKDISESVVLFFDEIDSTLSIPFSDDFFVALRAIYNARSTTPEFKRLSFVLIGVAAPRDLISDNRRTPFNIGHRVELTDFTIAEALPLAEGLGLRPEVLLSWVFRYTDGHPYLTQRLCAYLSNLGRALNEDVVRQAVDDLFIGQKGKQDNNLQFVQDMLTKRSPGVGRVLATYKNIRLGKGVSDDERTPEKMYLKLSGVVKADQGYLRVRNGIYKSIFTPGWVQQNTPRNWARVAAISFAIMTFVLLGILIRDNQVSGLARQYEQDFYSVPTLEKLQRLAFLFELEGVFQNTNFDFKARELFYGLNWQEQITLFQSRDLGAEDKENYLPIIVDGLYVTMANVESQQDNSDLLQIMKESLRDVETAQSVRLQYEIGLWLDARNATDDQYALQKYDDAIRLNDSNPSTRYERAIIELKLGSYEQGLLDLEKVITLAQDPSIKDSETENPIPTRTTTGNATIQTDSVIATSTPSTTVPFQTPVSTISSTQPNGTSEAPASDIPFHTPVPVTPVATSNPVNDPPPSRAGYRSSFYSVISIRSAIELVLQQHKGTLGFNELLVQMESVLVNLSQAGLLNTPIAGPQAAANTIVVAGAEMRLIPAGEFTMGSENGASDEQPVHPIYLDDFYMDTYEVTNVLYANCVQGGGCTPPRDTSSSTNSSYYGNPQFDDYPVIHVDWNQARAYCEWRGGSLPTEAQWEKATRGTDERTYPWGEGIDCTKANYFGCIGGTTEVGSYEDGKSPYGIHDLAGNVREWVADWNDDNYYASSPSSNPLGPASGQARVQRGGAWNYNGNDLRASNRDRLDPGNSTANVGFRCAMDATTAPNLALYGWWSPSRGDNLATTTWPGNAGDIQSPDYEFVRLEGYIFNPNQAQPAGTVPLYRWYSGTNGDTFITTMPQSTGDPNPTRSADYQIRPLEGYIYSPDAPQPPGTVALYGWWSDARKDYFTTTTPIWGADLNVTKSPDYAFVRLEGYVIAASTPSLISTATSTSSLPSAEISIVQSFLAPGSNAEGITWDGVNLWITDNSATIFKVDPGGTPLDSFVASEGTPQGITWDGANLWVYTTNRSRIYQIAQDGGQALGYFESPAEVVGGGVTQDMAWDGQSIWYANQFRVYQLDRSGAILSSFVFPSNVSGLDWDGSHLWIAYYNTSQELLFSTVDRTGSVLNTYASSMYELDGMVWADGYLWAVGRNTAGGDSMVYQLEIP
jgi:formylglycine-generating enzyme required for sulfatase activity